MRHIKFTYVQNLQTKLINKSHRHTQNKQMETRNKSKNYDEWPALWYISMLKQINACTVCLFAKV